MRYDQYDFIWDVINEAIALRKHATKEERLKINLYRLAPMSEYGCIYGQATGSCFSQRAAELIKLCCTRYFYSGAIKHVNIIREIVKNVNGTEVEDFLIERTDRWAGKHYSAIEAYITLPEAKNENLIAYLREETETLNIYL